MFLGQITTNDDNLLNNRFRENLDDTKKEGDVEGYLEQEGELMLAFSSGTICKLCLYYYSKFQILTSGMVCNLHFWVRLAGKYE